MPLRRLGLLALFLLSACRPFEYSPTSGDGYAKPRSNLRNIERILAAGDEPRLRARIAVLADVHQSYDELEDAVARINSDSSIDFTVVDGDLTKYGYAREYDWISGILGKLRAPVIAVVGNHDLQANGRTFYARAFGPTDFTFAWRGYSFVFFDDNARDVKGVPDWDWLEGALGAGGDSLPVVPICHVPPYTDQLDSVQSARLVGLYSRHHALIVIGAHTHRYEYREPYGDGIPYLVVDDLADRNFAVVTLEGGKATVERIFF